jgi:polyisoprenoid-binding protein YceI
LIEIESGFTTFYADTNVPDVEVKGKSTALSGQVEVSEDANGLVLQRIEASAPMKSLGTGMKVRDEHMRKYIFTTADGQEPNLVYAADQGACRSAGNGREFTCELAGSFSLRGEARPLVIRLRVKEQSGASTAFRVEGDAIVKLSDYGIAPPSQFGVKPSNEVKLHLDFTGRPRSAR